MNVSDVDRIRWIAGTLAEALVLVLAWRRRVFDRQPFFMSYLSLLVFHEIAIAVIFAKFGSNPYISYYAYWGTQAVLVTSRGTAVYEVFRVLLRPFSGVWKVCRSTLLLIAGVIAFGAVLTAIRTRPLADYAISGAERRLELAIVGVLLFGLAFCRYYHVRIPVYLTWMGLGFGFYSTVQIVNNSFWQQDLVRYFTIWKNVNLYSFDSALTLWAVALWKPLPAMAPVPARLPPGTYEAIAPQMSSRLRELNARLLEMWK